MILDKNIGLKDINWEDQADMIVVGGGGAGFAAAIEAARNHNSVLILEKNSFVGGDTLRSAGMMMAAGTDIQKKNDIKDTPENFAKAELRHGGLAVNRDMVKEMTKASPNEVKFMSSLGRKFNSVSPMLPIKGYDNKKDWAPRTTWAGMEGRTGHFRTLEKEVQKHNSIKVKTSTEAVHLITNYNEVVGVITKNGDKYLANKGVLLATASFGRNEAMSKRYNPMNYWALKYEDNFNTPSSEVQSTKNTGDGIRMGQEVGADLALSDAVCMGDCAGLFGDFYGSILLNNQGRRFTQENAMWGYFGTRVYHEAIKQNCLDPSKIYFWFIVDKTAADNSVRYKPIIHHKEIKPLSNNAFFKTANESYFKLIQKADTVDELADKIGLPKAEVKNSVLRWNQMVEKGKDTDFGRSNVNGTKDMEKLEKAPFYALPYISYSMGGFGGLKVNRQTQVIDVNHQPISRLYAAGALISGMFTAPFYNGCGWSVMGTVHWGRKAGRNISQLNSWTSQKIEVKNQNRNPKEKIQKVIANANGNYKPGTYSASYPGKYSKIPIWVSLTSNAISDIKIGENKEDAGIGVKAMSQIRRDILIRQTPKVDVVSGASLSSKSVINSVKDCLNQASRTSQTV